MKMNPPSHRHGLGRAPGEMRMATIWGGEGHFGDRRHEKKAPPRGGGFGGQNGLKTGCFGPFWRRSPAFLGDKRSSPNENDRQGWPEGIGSCHRLPFCGIIELRTPQGWQYESHNPARRDSDEAAAGSVQLSIKVRIT